VLGASFTDIAQAQAPASNTICQACAATSKTEGWGQYVAAHPERGLPSHFPQKSPDKPPKAWNWLFNSHLFRRGHHECPDRSRWREILLCPPDPPFLAVIAVSGKKQLVFKSKIAGSLDSFPVQFEDESIVVRPSIFREALEIFEALYRLGFSKDSILTGKYHPRTLLDVGPGRWRDEENKAAPWRRKTPQLWAICHYVAQKETPP